MRLFAIEDYLRRHTLAQNTRQITLLDQFWNLQLKDDGQIAPENNALDYRFHQRARQRFEKERRQCVLQYSELSSEHEESDCSERLSGNGACEHWQPYKIIKINQ